MKKLLFIALFSVILITPAKGQGLLGSLLGESGKSKGPVIRFVEGDKNAQDEILLIKLNGVIQEKNEEEGVMALKPKRNMIDVLRDDLRIAAERKAVKAILFEINSPGGEVTASDLIYHLVKKTSKDTGKPVVALIGAMGASGAYYSACAAQKIYAMPTSMIGSIGVVMQAMNIEELASKIGLKPLTFKSDKTPMKDILSPFREMTEDEKAMLMELINDTYNRFTDIVAESRKMSKEDVIKAANGAIYTPTKAKALGLIDEIGYREDAMEECCKLSNIKSAALVKRESKSGGLDQLLGILSERSDIRPIVSELISEMQFGAYPVMMFK